MRRRFSWIALGVTLGLVAITASVNLAQADEAVRITTNAAVDREPAWSPDGTQIAFTSYRGGNADIWVIPATGGTATQITTDPADDYLPTWSPDGSQIAFGSWRDGTDGIWVIPATGGIATQITTNPAGETCRCTGQTATVRSFSHALTKV